MTEERAKQLLENAKSDLKDILQAFEPLKKSLEPFKDDSRVIAAIKAINSKIELFEGYIKFAENDSSYLGAGNLLEGNKDRLAINVSKLSDLVEILEKEKAAFNLQTAKDNAELASSKAATDSARNGWFANALSTLSLLGTLLMSLKTCTVADNTKQEVRCLRDDLKSQVENLKNYQDLQVQNLRNEILSSVGASIQKSPAVQTRPSKTKDLSKASKD